MGQVHPTGPNVVGLRERGGGKDCDCGPPHFDTSNYDTRFAQAGISKVEFDAKMERVHEHEEKEGVIGYTCERMCVSPGDVSCCTMWCCSVDHAESNGWKPPSHYMKSRQPFPTTPHELSAAGQAACIPYSDAETLGNAARFTLRRESAEGSDIHIQDECHKEGLGSWDGYVYPDVYNSIFTPWEGVRGDEEEQEAALCQATFLWVLIAPIGVFGVIAWFCHARKVKERKLCDIFVDWGTRGIRMQYIRPTKHTDGWLYFILPAGVGALPPNAQPLMTDTGAYQPLMLSSSHAAVAPVATAHHQPPLGQQPVGMPVAQPQQKMPVLMSVTVPTGVLAGQQMNIQAPDGRQFQVVVPSGVAPGQAFQVQA